MKKRILHFCLFFSILKASGQNDTLTFYFNEGLQTLDSKDGAGYIGKGFQENAVWKLIISNIKRERSY